MRLGGLQWRWYAGEVIRIGVGWLKALLLGSVATALAALPAFGAASAVAQGPDVTFTAEGPSTAHPGDTVRYRLHWTVEGGPSADVVLNWAPGKTTYVSTKVISGEVHLCQEPAVGATEAFVRCTLRPPTGTLEVTLGVLPDVASGKMTFGGSEPGTGGGPGRPLANSNTVTTLITPPGVPDTGSGSLTSGVQAIPGWLVALLVAGGIGGLVAAARLATSGRTR